MAPLSWLCFIVFLFFASDTAYSTQSPKPHFPTPPRSVRLILVDIDGTLTGPDRVFVENNIEGFHLARKLGIQVAFCTGRTPATALALFGEEMQKKTGYSGAPAVYMNGTYVVNAKGELIVDRPLPAELKTRLLAAFKANGLGDRIHGSSAAGHLQFNEETERADEKCYKVLSFGDPKHIQKVRPLLEAQFKGEVEFFEGLVGCLEALPIGIHKGTGLQALAAELGVDPDEILALGDTEADVPMFEAAGTSVAVANADKLAKQAADYITVDSLEGALTAVVKEIERLGFYPGALKMQDNLS